MSPNCVNSWNYSDEKSRAVKGKSYWHGGRNPNAVSVTKLGTGASSLDWIEGTDRRG